MVLTLQLRKQMIEPVKCSRIGYQFPYNQIIYSEIKKTAVLTVNRIVSTLWNKIQCTLNCVLISLMSPELILMPLLAHNPEDYYEFCDQRSCFQLLCATLTSETEYICPYIQSFILIRLLQIKQSPDKVTYQPRAWYGSC